MLYTIAKKVNLKIVLYKLIAFLLNYGWGGRKWFKQQIGSLVVLIFSILEEISQLYIPSRSFDFADIAASVAGIVLFTILFQIVDKKKR